MLQHSLASVVVVDSSNTDLVVDGRRLPRPGETIMGGLFRRSSGGKNANQAMAATRAGAKVIFVRARGGDQFGTEAKLLLWREGIGTRYFFKKSDDNSGVALILLSGQKKQNMIAVAKSANDLLTIADVRKAEKAIARAGVVVAQLEIPLRVVEEVARLAAKHGVPFILNPAPAQKLPKRLFKLTTLITPNETDAELLTDRKKTLLAARDLVAMGCKNVLVTLGAKGSLLVNQEGAVPIKPPKVRVVDTVGAGDCLTGWLAAL
jgi:ribokinase